ncbi:uncharacterized protein LOC110424808 [Herrania umbratica]|uniref:Uncharacterized protein LOC110424808 n=1 Tax=Herrania umbratica TaxID=108875 RepID=A0A6J1B7J9_9ROSI|nr:uncharacterized protein LOC110424808 [Herrania umbratica]
MRAPISAHRCSPKDGRLVLNGGEIECLCPAGVHFLLRILIIRCIVLQGLLGAGAGAGWHVAGVLLGTTYDDDEEVELLEQGSLNPKELASGKLGQSPTISSQMPSAGKEPSDSSQMPFAKKLIASLEATGVRIYGLDAPHQNSSWDNIAGYHKQKRCVKNLMALASLMSKPVGR